MKRMLTSICLILLVGALVMSPAHSAGTKLWNFTQIETWLEGEFQGTGLTSRGNVIPTMLTERTDVPARLAWESVPIGRNGHFIATSLPAGIYLQTANGDISNVLSLDQLGVTAMERHDDQIYAGASPSGTIYQYNADENSSVARSFDAVATLSDSYVWDMETSPDGHGLYIASGPDGSLHHLDRDGNLSRVATVPAHNVMTLASHEGSLYLGDDRGSVYKIDAGDRNGSSLTSVYGFSRGEVAAISSDDAHLYLAVNIRQTSGRERSKQEQISKLAAQLRQQSMREQLKQRIKASPRKALQSSTSDSPPSVRMPGSQSPVSPGPSPSPRQSTQSMLEAVRQSSESGQSELFQGLSGTLVYKMDPPKQMNIVYNDPNEIVHDLEAHDGTLYVATGGKGRLYKIKPDFTRVAYFQSSQKLILDAELEDGEPVRITTGEGAAIFHRQPFNKRDVYYRSRPLDAQLLSQWGTLKSIGSNNLRFRTRSGNSNEPDTNWNQWSSYNRGTQFSIPSDPARFLQFEAHFQSPESQLKNVQIAYRIPNQQPQISTFEISPNPYRMSVTQAQSPGGNGESSQSASAGANQTAQSGRMSVRQIAWKAMDPDGDQLSSTVYYRPIGTSQWLTLVSSDEVEGSSYNWNLGDYSDGWYELRLEVSDKSQNPPGEGYTAYQQLGPVLVDNTAPAIRNLKRSDDTISFTARDETSWILRAEYRVNGEDWRPLQPTDGILDQPKETFEFELPKQTDSNSVVEVRTMDEGGNVTLRRLDPRE